MGFKIATQRRNSNRIRRSTERTASLTRRHSSALDLQRTLGNAATSRIFTTGHIQRKLAVSQPNDPSEREADRVAGEVMRMPEAQPGSNIQHSALSIQRKCAKCEENLKPRPTPDEEEKIIQAKPANTLAAPEVSSGFESHIDNIRGGGQPLPETARAFFEPRFGYDFSDVRIHTDSDASESARALNARAYTHGTDIVFAKGQYSPESQLGQNLLTHELAHVVQQSGSHATPVVQREVQERSFPGGGKAEEVRPGEHLLWNFDIGQHALRQEHSAPIRTIASEIKVALTRDPSALIDIEGQASFTGTQNDELSAQRAEAVKRALVGQGIAADRLNLISVGSLKAFPGESQENFARSRAVRVIMPPHLLLPVGPQPTQPQTGACQAHATDMTLEGATVEVTRQPLILRIHAGSGDGNPPGMTMSAGVSMKPANCGTLVFVQDVQAFRQIVYKDRSRNTFQTPGFTLDTADPYPTQVFDDPKNPGLAVAQANDSPSQGIFNFPLDDEIQFENEIQTVEARDDFRMFLLFEPKGETRQALQIGEWSWAGQLRNAVPNEFKLGRLEKDPSASRIMPTTGKGRATAELPVLSPNATSTEWVTNNAGDPKKTLADWERPHLNRNKPKPNSS